jgi:hypothetical protein
MHGHRHDRVMLTLVSQPKAWCLGASAWTIAALCGRVAARETGTQIWGGRDHRAAGIGSRRGSNEAAG